MRRGMDKESLLALVKERISNLRCFSIPPGVLLLPFKFRNVIRATKPTAMRLLTLASETAQCHQTPDNPDFDRIVY